MAQVNVPGFQQAMDILLRFVLDKQALNDLKTGSTSIGVALDNVGLSETDIALAGMKLAPILQEQEKQAGKLQIAWWRAQRELRAAQFAMTSMIAVGGAILAPFVAAAANWSKEMEKAGATTDPVYAKWKAASDKIKGAELELGRATAEVLLPTLEKVAELADKGAKFVDKHPEIIKAALTTGAALVTIGTIGSLLVQGIKLYVDVKFVVAAGLNKLSGDLMLAAAKMNLEAAALMNAGKTVPFNVPPISAAGGLQAILQRLAAAVLTLVKNVGLIALPAAALTDLVAQMRGGAWRDTVYGAGKGTAHNTLDPLQNLREMLAANLIGREKGLLARGQVTQQQADDFEAAVKAFLHLDNAVKDTTSDLQSAADILKQAQLDKEGAKILDKLDKDLLKLAQNYAKDRLKIEKDLTNDLTKAAEDLAKKLANIDLDLARSLAKLARDYANDNQKAIEDEQLREQEIIQKGNDEIAKIKRDGQKQLERLEQDHKNKIWDLAMANDALGIAIENRRYQQERSNAQQDINDQIREKRREIAQQLAEQRKQFALEQAQRARDYQLRIQEEQIQAQQQRDDAQAAYQEERKQAFENEKQRLQDLQDQYEEERKQKILSAYQDIVALGGALETERTFKKRYYDIMVADAQAFAEAYKAALDQIASSTLPDGTTPPPTTPGYAIGGYTSAGLARLHKNEFVMSPATTRAAEQLTGGQLTQQSIVAALAARGRGSVTLVDQRRFDSRLHPEDREQIRQDTLALILEATSL